MSLGKTASLWKNHPDILTMRMGKRTSRYTLDERMKRIISFLLREHATVFYRGIFLFWHKTDLHGWRTDGRACSHNLKSVHGNEEKKITFFNLIILKIKAHTPAGKENKKRLFAGLHPVVMLAGMVA